MDSVLGLYCGGLLDYNIFFGTECFKSLERREYEAEESLYKGVSK